MVLLVCSLAACNAAPAPPLPEATIAAATATPEPSSLPTRAPTEEPASTLIPELTAEPQALTLWAVATGAEREQLAELLTEIGQQAGVDLAVVVKSADGLQADVRADLLVGAPLPDLFWGTQEDLGLLQRIDALQQADDGLPAEDFIPATIQAATLDGTRWGTPVAANNYLLLLYNRELVNAAPRTTDELISQSRAQNTGGRSGLVAGWAEPRWFAALLTGYGGTLARNGQPTLDTDETINALNLLKELRVAGPATPSTYADGRSLFIRGNAAFALDGDWALETYRQYTETLDLGIAPMPVVPSTGRVAAPPLNGIYLMYSSTLDGSRLTEARALSAALVSPDTQATLARELAVLPALRSALDTPAVTDDPALAAAAAQINGAIGLPAEPGLRCAWEAVRGHLPLVLLDTISQEDGARRMQESALACTMRDE